MQHKAVFLCAIGLWLWLALGACVGLDARAAAPADSLATQINALERHGRARPRETVAELERLLTSAPPYSAERLELLTLRGLLLAQTPGAQGGDEVSAELQAWGRDHSAPQATSAALLVQAAALYRSGALPRADAMLTEALARLPQQQPARDRFRYLRLMAAIKDSAGQLDQTVKLYTEAMALADQLASPWRQADMSTRLAYAYFEAKQLEQALKLNARAMAIATQAEDWYYLAAANNIQGELLEASGDLPGELREMLAAIENARRAGSKELEILYLQNLADYYLRSGDYKTSLVYSEKSLPLVRELKYLNAEAVALSNIGMAEISMKNIEAGRRHVQQSLAIDEKRGSLRGMSATYLDLGTYLERAGETRTAVEAFHAYRRLADTILRQSQQRTILETQERFDAERRTRELDLLHRDGQLKDEQLRQRDLQRRVWWLLLAAGVLSFAMLALLYRRVRQSNLALRSNNAQLLVQSERDPLTGLANRRHFQRAIKRLAADGKLVGTVFLIDIDHFKHINDRHGHAVGDAVLVEIARRLRDTLRDADLIVRWGGEEFLVLVRALSAEQVLSLAQRMLDAIAAVSVTHNEHTVHVTASFGFASFPIQPRGLAVTWGLAINLVDTAMYLAKTHGRNRAYGVRLLQAQSEAELQAITASLEAAWREGQVTLSLLQGPTAELPV